MVQELIIEFVFAVARLLAAIVLSAGALYTGMDLLDRLTSGIEEWKEIKKGNVAAGIIFVAVMVSMVLLMEERITDFVGLIQGGFPVGLTIKMLALAFINYVLGLLVSIAAIFLSIHTIDRITSDVDEFAELKKGNVAVALIFAAAVVLIAFIARYPVESAFDNLIRMESVLL